MRSTFHHGSLKSTRLTVVLNALKSSDDRGMTTIDIYDYCYPMTTRPSSDISELRANGIKIESKRVGKSANGGQIWRYKLVK